MEEEMEKWKIFGKFESMTKKKSSEMLADEKKILEVKVRRKSVISENDFFFLESLNPPPSQIPAYATGWRINLERDFYNPWWGFKLPDLFIDSQAL